MAQAWHTAWFGRVKKLKPLRSYLKERRPRTRLTAEQKTWISGRASAWADRLNRR